MHLSNQPRCPPLDRGRVPIMSLSHPLHRHASCAMLDTVTDIARLN